MKQILISIFTICICGTLLSSAEKVGTTSFQFLKLAPDARSAGMGGAYTSVTNSSDAVFWNPAALRLSTGIDFSASYIDYFLDVNISSIAFSIPITSAATLGLQAMVVNYGEIEVTEVSYLRWNDDYTQFNPGLTGELIYPNASVYGVSYARTLTNKFNFGVTARYMTENLIRKKASTVSFDGGLTYDTGWRSVKMAATVRNFGPEVTFLNESYPIPETFTFGISAFVFSPFSSLFTQSDKHSLLVSYDLTHPRDYDQQHNVGIEYSFLKLFLLRAGYQFNYDEQGICLGSGLRIKKLRVDYAYDPFGTILDSVHRFSIGYGMN